MLYIVKKMYITYFTITIIILRTFDNLSDFSRAATVEAWARKATGSDGGSLG